MSKLWRPTRLEYCSSNEERRIYLYEFLKNDIFTDCQFLVNENTISAHKLILAKASPVFAELLYSEGAEKNPIQVSVMRTEAFKKMLEYIYTEKIDLDSIRIANQYTWTKLERYNANLQILYELWYGAKVYQLPYLYSTVKDSISKDINFETVCIVYQLVLKFDDEMELKAECERIIQINTTEILSTEIFYCLNPNTLKEIFSLDVLNIESEMDLFKALTRYVKNQKLKEIMKKDALKEELKDIDVEIEKADVIRNPELLDIAKQIRFLTLSDQEFMYGPACSSLLTENQVSGLRSHVLNRCSKEPVPRGFSTSRVQRRHNLVTELVDSLLWCEQVEEKTASNEDRSEIFLKISLENMSNLAVAVSPPFFLRKVPWQFIIMLNSEFLDAGLKCELSMIKEREDLSDSEDDFLTPIQEILVETELLVLSHKKETRSYYDKFDVKEFLRLTNVQFCRILPSEVVLDPKKGYLKDGAISIEVHIICSKLRACQNHRQTRLKTVY